MPTELEKAAINLAYHFSIKAPQEGSNVTFAMFELLDELTIQVIRKFNAEQITKEIQ